MNIIKKFFLVIFIVLLPSFCLGYTGKVIGISDGDTITILTTEKAQIKIRLYGIDTPEKNQGFGQKAKQFTSDLAFGKEVNVDQIDIDKYGRTVGIVKIDKFILNEELLKNGFAWQYEQYCKRPECAKWKEYESTAKEAKLGLWSDNSSIPPWEYRRGEKISTTGDIQKPLQQKNSELSGNIQSGIFHGSNCKYFNCKNCSKIFKNREEAINEGFRPCKVCNP